MGALCLVLVLLCINEFCNQLVEEGELAHSHSLARAFADCTKKSDVDEGSGQIVYSSSCDLGIYRICKQQIIRRDCTSCTVSPEPSLIALKRRDVDEGSGQIVYTSSCDLGIYRICQQQMIRRACTFCTVSPEPSLIVLKGWM